MSRQGLMDDCGYYFSVPIEMCEKCIYGMEKQDRYNNMWYNCKFNIKDIDCCEYSEVK